jgi:hypothetical protein
VVYALTKSAQHILRPLCIYSIPRAWMAGLSIGRPGRSLGVSRKHCGTKGGGCDSSMAMRGRSNREISGPHDMMVRKADRFATMKQKLVLLHRFKGLPMPMHQDLMQRAGTG